ncbi:MAG TPA: hypothetical protein VFI13_01015, partial [Gemmatimonadales bacterium]|nr:hypothetical protein [Gemmatimonadales bacterium]
MHARSAVLALLLVAGLGACRPAATVVVVTSTGADGKELPVAQTPLVILPYDRDSVAAALLAAAPARPDTMPLVRLLDSLRTAYRRSLAATGAATPAARARYAALRDALTPAMDSLRQLQQAWRTAAFGGYDTLTLALTHRLARDPFTDTTDAQGVADVRPRMSGPWWVTATTWDPADPYSEWYWNVPLTGDTVRLSTAT